MDFLRIPRIYAWGVSRLFKFTDDLQGKLEELLAKNQIAPLTATEQEELDSISELDRIFTYLNSLLAAQK